MACIAVVNIPQGSCSKPFRSHEISIGSISELRGNMKINFPFQIGISPTGELSPISSFTTIFWPKLLDIASDCHDQNVKLCRWHTKDTFMLQTTRDIPAGQKLQMWFSEDLMMSDLAIPPFLSPFNIKGGDRYVCHTCQQEFQRPNMLKLHLALHCDRLSLETIWNRLKSSGTSPLLQPFDLLNISPSIAASVTPNPIFSVTSPQSILRLSSPTLHPRSVLPMSDSHLSSNQGSTGITSSSTSSSTPSPGKNEEVPMEVPASPVEPVPEANGTRSLIVQEQHHHHARLEAIVSNMGKAKNGHVCLYCGKLYSRKYGLKIHIRTHTGYKPLRCKICHRPFGDPSNLNKHVRLHADATTPYRCKLCSKMLVRKRDLDRHMRTRHHGSTGHGTGRSNGNGNSIQPQCASGSHNRTSTVTSTINGIL